MTRTLVQLENKKGRTSAKSLVILWCSNPHPSLLVRKRKIKKAHGRSNQAILIWVLKIGSIMNHPIEHPLGVNVSGRLDCKYAIV